MRTPTNDPRPVTVPDMGIRFLLWAPLMIALGLVSWFVLAFTGWGSETSPPAQFARDASWLAVSAAAGVGAVAVFCRVIGAGARYWAVGAIPALVRASAYFADVY